MSALKELMLEMFSSRDRAITMATTTLEMRLNGMNEFREQLRDQASKFISRDEHETLRDLIERNDDKVGIMTSHIAALEAKLYLGGAGIVAILSVIQVLLNIWHVTH